MKNLIIALLVLICIWLLLGKVPNVGPVDHLNHSDTSTVLIYDTLSYELKGNPKKSNAYSVDSSGAIDTNLIIQEYLTRFILTDSLQDSNVTVVIRDTLFRNELTGRSLKYSLNKPVAITNTIVAPAERKARFYVGLFAQPGKSFSSGPEAFYSGRRFLVGVGYDLKNEAIQTHLLFNILR